MNFQLPAKTRKSLDFQPRYSKIIEALLFILHRKPGIDHYHACKLIYLADYTHLNRHGRPVVFDKHLAMKWGPVASKTLELLKRESGALRAAGIDNLPFDTTKIEKSIIMSNPHREANMDVFSKSDIRVLEEVIDKYADLTFGQLHDETAKHAAYKTAWSEKSIFWNSPEMEYADILEEREGKAEYLEDFGPVAKYMR